MEQEQRNHSEEPRRTRPEGERPRRPRPVDENGQPIRRPRPDGERPKRPRPVDENGQPIRRPRPEGEPQRRPRPVDENGEPIRRTRPEGDAPRRGTRFADEEPRRRPAEEGRPVRGSRFAEERPERPERPARPPRRDDDPPAPTRRRPAPPVEEVAAPPAKAEKPKKPKKKRKPISAWRTGMALYICIAIVAMLFGMHQLWIFLDEYESSRPQYTIDGYVGSLNMNFYDDMLRQKIDELPLSEYETADTIFETLAMEEVEEAAYTWIKKADAYTDEHPVYFIRYGNGAIATVELETAGKTQHFGFPIWRCMEPVSLMNVATTPEYNISVNIPEGATLSVNGQQVPLMKMTEGEAPVQLDEAALAVIRQENAGKAQYCEIRGLYVSPEVVACDAKGAPLSLLEEVDPAVKQQSYVFVPADAITPDPALVIRMEELTKAYINYMINKDEATWNNLNYLDNFLVRNSNVYTTLHSMIQDVSWNNPYTNRVDKLLEIDHVKMYAENVCTCVATFDLELTKKVVNDYKGTVQWTMVRSQNGTWNACDFKLLQTEGDDTAPETPEADTPEQP